MHDLRGRLGPDALGLALTFAAIGAVIARFYAWSAEPTEDAAILMRYAAHLAAGHGIVWNIGESPVDGATDFLFMVSIAALVKVGIGLYTATQTLVLGAHLGATALVFASTRRSGFSAMVATATATFFGLGPGLGFAEAYFGTPFFAFWAALTWYLAIRVREGAPIGTHGIGCALAALGLGLTRPDGVLLAGFIVATLCVSLDRRRAVEVFTAFAAVFGTLGVLYFAWRWWYFTHPLPNPYYKKGEFQLWPHSFITAVRTVLRSLAPLLPFYLLALRSREGAREAMFSAIPIAGFTAIWILVSDEMNYLGRFQYAVFPIAVMSAPSLIAAALRAWGVSFVPPSSLRDRALVGALALALCAALPVALFRPPLPGGRDGRTVIGEGLAAYADEGYTLATTEAGLLPLVSRWRSVDTWGLNDVWIAHNGAITETYLEAKSPDLVLVHAARSPVFRDARIGAALGPEWDAMTDLLSAWCARKGYTLAAAWGASHTDTFEFWVRADNPHHDALVSLIRDARFDFLGGPGPFVDFARVTGDLRLALPYR